MNGPNWERLEKLYCTVSADREHFSMNQVFGGEGYPERRDGKVHWCNSVGCFAGYAFMLWDKNPATHWNSWYSTGSSVMARAAVLLGLNSTQADWLFAAAVDPGQANDLIEVRGLSSEDEALRYLRACIDAREVIHPGHFWVPTESERAFLDSDDEDEGEDEDDYSDEDGVDDGA